MAESFKSLRMRRLRNRVSKRDLAQRLGCAESWLNTLELHNYTGPAARRWRERYKEGLESIIQEKKS